MTITRLTRCSQIWSQTLQCQRSVRPQSGCLMLGGHFIGFHKRLSDTQETFPQCTVSNAWSSPLPEGRLPGAVTSFSLSDHTDWSKWHNWLIQSPAGWKWPLSPRGFPDTLAHTNSRPNTPCVCTFIPAASGFAVHTHVQCSHRCSSIVAGFSER